MKRGLILGSFLFMACGGKVGLLDELAVASDAGADSALPDSTPPRDTGTWPLPDASPPPFDTAPPPPTTCATPLSPGFTCTAPAPGKGQTVCTDDAIRAIVNGCFTGDGGGCDSARKKFPACERCMLQDWLDEGSLNVGACILAVSPGNPCAKTVKCGMSCLAEVCGSCDPSPGTGSGGMSELDDCYSNESYEGGKCYAVAMRDYVACSEEPKLSVCFPYDLDAVLPFYRGACRDGGDWSKAFTP